MTNRSTPPLLKMWEIGLPTPLRIDASEPVRFLFHGTCARHEYKQTYTSICYQHVPPQSYPYHRSQRRVFHVQLSFHTKQSLVTLLRLKKGKDKVWQSDFGKKQPCFTATTFRRFKQIENIGKYHCFSA